MLKNSESLFYVYYKERYTYRDCYKAMLRINSVLYKMKKKRVALYTSKSFNAYTAILSIFLSGNTWVPFSTTQPVKRNLDMLKITKPEIIITGCSLPVLIREYAHEMNIPVYILQEVIESDRYREIELSGFSKDDIAYIMFTSGSTGVPKGVLMTHKNYINFIENVIEVLPFGKKEVFSDYHDYGFDISIFYLFCAVITESAFAPILKPEERLFPLDNIINNKVTVWSSVPSAITQIQTLRPYDKINTPIKIMFLCGEPFRLDILRYCFENLGLKNIYNFYGLTETGVENFYHECKYEDLEKYKHKGFVPIGRPLKKGSDIKITEEKELLLSGCQITPGYLDSVGKERFETIDGIRWYHTGDIVERFEDVYFCKGRLDSQLKICGYRVELMDIEVNVRQFVEVEDAVCIVDDKNNRKLLVCAIKTKGKISYTKLKEYLKTKLPDYMIPQKYFTMNEFPGNKNGKIDRKKILIHYKTSKY